MFRNLCFSLLGAILASIALTAVADESTIYSDSRMFGKYRLTLGVAKPTFTDLKDYEEFYGNTRGMPSLQVDYYLFDWFLTTGVTFRANFYKDKGYALEANSTKSDHESPIEITLIPLQVGVTMQATPFRAKWIVLNGWLGYEYTYFQEVRLSETEASSTTAGTSSDNDNSSGSSSTTGDESGTYVNQGWKAATALGFSASFRLNGLDGQAAHSLRGMGLSSVYLTPYMEMVRTLQKKGITFSRTAVGIAFTFETI